MFILVKRRFKSSFFCIQSPFFSFFIQKSRLFDAETTILRAFQTFLRPVPIIRKA